MSISMSHLPKAERTAPAVELVTSDEDLTFEAARLQALNLQMQFAAAKEAYGAKTALALYMNPQYNTWADQWSDPVDRVILKAARGRFDGATHTYNEAWAYLAEAVNRLSCACGPEHDPANRQCPGKVTVSADTVKRRVRRWAENGVAYIQANNNRTREGSGGRMFSSSGRGGKQAGTDSPNTVTLNLGIVLKLRDGWDEVAKKRVKSVWAEPWDIRTISGKYQPRLNGDTEQTKLQGSSTPLAGVKHPNTSNSQILNESLPTNPGGTSHRTLEVEVGPPGKTQGMPKPQSPAQPGSRQWDKNPGDRNTLTFWQASKGNQVWTHDKPRPKRVPGDAKTVTLAPKESSWMWNRWPKGRPQEQLDFLRMFPSMRARMIENADQEEDRQAARRAAMRADLDRFDPIAFLVSAHRGVLVSAGVTDTEIDQRIASEWSDLDGTALANRLKNWARKAQAANDDNED